jgi:hypothetical protein
VGKKRTNKRILSLLIIGTSLIISLCARTLVNPVTVSETEKNDLINNLTNTRSMLTDIRYQSTQSTHISSTLALIIISYIYNAIIKENT